MMGNKKHRKWILIGSLILVVLCVISTLSIVLWQRSRNIDSRPLVLIHNPANRAVVTEGEVVSLHATARSASGLKKMEFWIDDQLIAEKLSLNSDTTNMTLVDVWNAIQPGEHVIIARAISKNGVDGQATISIKVTEADYRELMHIVEEGETLDIIAEEYGVSSDALAGANRELDESGLEAGDELMIPDSEPSTGSPEAPESNSPAPIPEDDAPGSLDSMADMFDLDLSDYFGRSQDTAPVGLRLELLELTTDAFEGLHCYIGAGLSPSKWYPDLDSNQSTDESFELIGERSWNVRTHLMDESAPVIFWPQNEPLNARVACVGITGGGTDALELGTWEENIPAERWTGIPLVGEASGPDGSFSFSYRIGRVGISEGIVPMYLDPDMASPTNVRLDADSNRLRWDYTPPDDEEPITGFRIYLNNNLQWVEPPNSRASMIPYEWFHPPCGNRYIFSVSAFIYALPDGPESFPAITSIDTPEEDCHREIEISFLTLETFDLGRDDSSERKIGDRGPVYGDFTANENSISFSGGSLGAGLDVAAGFEHNTLYDLFDLWRSGWWGFTDSPTLTADVPPGGSFEFSYIIKDRDDESSNDVICDGQSIPIYEEAAYGHLDEVHEGTLLSDNSRCELTYQYGPASGSPVGSGVVGQEPMPWLVITDLNIIEETGHVQIHLRNSGTATWPWKDLQIELQTREGESLGIYTWTEFLLETGDSTFVSQPSMRVDAPFDVCALLDPNDLVIESMEASGASIHHPYCPELPDLTIANIVFDSIDNSLQVVVQNIGAGALENRSMQLTVILPDGSPAHISADYAEISLEPREMRTFFLPGISESDRATLAGGYTMVIDEDDLIFESDESNNSYGVVPTQLDICWCDSRIPHYRGSGSTARMFLTAEILSGSDSTTVLTSSRSSTLGSRETSYSNWNHTWDQGHSGSLFSCSEQFEPIHIMGDQLLRVSIEADFLAGSRGDRDNLGTAYMLLTPDSLLRIPASSDHCYDNHHMYMEVLPSDSDYDDEEWFTYLSVGKIVP